MLLNLFLKPWWNIACIMLRELGLLATHLVFRRLSVSSVASIFLTTLAWSSTGSAIRLNISLLILFLFHSVIWCFEFFRGSCSSFCLYFPFFLFTAQSCSFNDNGHFFTPLSPTLPPHVLFISFSRPTGSDRMRIWRSLSWWGRWSHSKSCIWCSWSHVFISHLWRIPTT